MPGQADDSAEQQAGERELPGHDAARDDHPGADGLVRRLVEQDERAGRAVLGVRDRRRAARRAAAGRRRCRSARAARARARRRACATSTTRDELVDDARTERVVCLIASFARGSSGRSLIQQTRASSSRATTGGRRGIGEHVAARDVEVVREPDRHRHAAAIAASSGPSTVSTAATRVRRPDGRTTTSSPARQTPPATWPRVAAVVVVLVRHRPDHPLHGEAPAVEVAVGGDLDRLEVLEQRRPVVPRHLRRSASTTLSPCSAEIGITVEVRQPERVEVAADLVEALLRPVDEIHLVHRDDDVRDAEHRRRCTRGRRVCSITP